MRPIEERLDEVVKAAGKSREMNPLAAIPAAAMVHELIRRGYTVSLGKDRVHVLAARAYNT